MKIFITGIGTDVGKTIASAIVVEALEADYWIFFIWKPIETDFKKMETDWSQIISQNILN